MRGTGGRQHRAEEDPERREGQHDEQEAGERPGRTVGSAGAVDEPHGDEDERAADEPLARSFHESCQAAPLRS
jgi:hypothetical protein